jgi:glycosyltransferase involved in cell wall biosynthesis
MNNKPKLSIIVLTYYHEKYIRYALDSILAQNVNFKYEVLVGDDASRDATPEILKEYTRKHPNIFKVILRKKNIGAVRNGVDLLKRATGEYIAQLEGDDYWLDLNKLQKQVDFLDKNKEFIGCAHKCVIVDENGVPDYTKSPSFVYSKKIFSLNNYSSKADIPGQAATLVFRNVIKDWSPIERVHLFVGDKTLMLMLLSWGDFYVFNDVMSAYRYVIDKKAGKNFFSLHFANPYWQHDSFMRFVRLNEYARSIGISTKIGKEKLDEYYTSLVENIINEPDFKRFKQLAEMTAKSREPLRYIGLIAKHLILK